MISFFFIKNNNFIYIYLMYILTIQDKLNIIFFPKCGCSNIIKYISILNNTFYSHNHSFGGPKPNNCDLYENIHNCAVNTKIKNKKLKTIFVYRNILLKTISYYNNNCCMNNYEIINKIKNFKNHISLINDEMHHIMYSPINDINIDYFINLDNFNLEFIDILNKENIVIPDLLLEVINKKNETNEIKNTNKSDMYKQEIIDKLNKNEIIDFYEEILKKMININL